MGYYEKMCDVLVSHPPDWSGWTRPAGFAKEQYEKCETARHFGMPFLLFGPDGDLLRLVDQVLEWESVAHAATPPMQVRRLVDRLDSASEQIAVREGIIRDSGEFHLESDLAEGRSPESAAERALMNQDVGNAARDLCLTFQAELKALLAGIDAEELRELSAAKAQSLAELEGALDRWARWTEAGSDWVAAGVVKADPSVAEYATALLLLLMLLAAPALLWLRHARLVARRQKAGAGKKRKAGGGGGALAAPRGGAVARRRIPFAERLRASGFPAAIWWLIGRVADVLRRRFRRRGGAAPLRCAHCGVDEGVDRRFRRCRRCKAARYCSKACQDAHWPAHRAGCGALVPTT